MQTLCWVSSIKDVSLILWTDLISSLTECIMHSYLKKNVSSTKHQILVESLFWEFLCIFPDDFMFTKIAISSLVNLSPVVHNGSYVSFYI